MTRAVLAASDLEQLFEHLHAAGRRVVGPSVRDGAVVLDELLSPRDLPRGWTDDQAPGHYRLKATGEKAMFAWVIGPQAYKRVLHEPRLRLWAARVGDEGLIIERERTPSAPLALIGPRACDLAALAIHDRVLAEGEVPDPHFAARRADLLVVAVQCGAAASTCFCTAMGTGPRVEAGYDLCLTELLDASGHRFVVEVGSPAGEALAEALPLSEAGDDSLAPEAASARAEAAISRHLPTDGLRERLLAALDGPGWDEVAERCLACGNCTLVCPVCFCTTTEEVPRLDGGSEHWRRWASCFEPAFSHLHGGPVRSSLQSRYRQWLTHKLATWHDQFGTSGCVGCGRCITWCPAGIDLVAEATSLADAAESP